MSNASLTRSASSLQSSCYCSWFARTQRIALLPTTTHRISQAHALGLTTSSSSKLRRGQKKSAFPVQTGTPATPTATHSCTSSMREISARETEREREMPARARACECVQGRCMLQKLTRASGVPAPWPVTPRPTNRVATSATPQLRLPSLGEKLCMASRMRRRHSGTDRSADSCGS